MEHAIIQHAERNAVLTVDPGGTESMEHAEMLMANAERNDVSTLELGVATEIMEHTQKILQHAMQHAEMVIAYAEMQMRLLRIKQQHPQQSRR